MRYNTWVTLAALAALATPASDALAGRIVQVSIDEHHHLQHHPEPLVLRAGTTHQVRWQLAARNRHLTLEVQGLDAAAREKAAVELEAPPGRQPYTLVVRDPEGHVFAESQATLEFEEQPPVSRRWLLLGAAGLLAAWVFNYIEPPLTRTYEPEAH